MNDIEKLDNVTWYGHCVINVMAAISDLPDEAKLLFCQDPDREHLQLWPQRASDKTTATACVQPRTANTRLQDRPVCLLRSHQPL
jgi:hypothetical protein